MITRSTFVLHVVLFWENKRLSMEELKNNVDGWIACLLKKKLKKSLK